MVENEILTTIAIYPSTKAQLDELRLAPGESYDHIIQRLLEANQKKAEANPQ